MFINFSYRNISHLIKKFTSYFKIKCQSFKLFRIFNIIAFNEIYCTKYIATDTENYVYKCLLCELYPFKNFKIHHIQSFSIPCSREICVCPPVICFSLNQYNVIFLPLFENNLVALR